MNNRREDGGLTQLGQYDEFPILIIDDNHSIYDDFCKVLGRSAVGGDLEHLESQLFDSSAIKHGVSKNYKLDYASQGQQGYQMIVDAQEQGRPYMLTFCDMRMPPGWDGLETIEHIVQIDNDIQIVICTAFTDHSFEEITTRLGNSANVLVLKKPFDSVEVRQLANALTEKWILNQRANLKMVELESLVQARTKQLRESEAIIREHNRHLEKEVAKRTEDLEYAKQRAEAANVAKSQFLANISHELRTPLHGILSFSNFGITKKQASADKKMEYFKRIQASGKGLLNLVNVLLDFAKLEAGKMSFNWSKQNFTLLVDEVCDEFSALCAEKEVCIKKKISGTLIPVVLDTEKTKQVIRNVVANAIKFTPSGGKVEVCTHYDDECLRFTVSDQGPGIPPEELVQIFDKFEQSSKIKEATGGTGLGLAISREIVDAHHGQIWAENNAKRGAKFTVLYRYEIDVTTTNAA